MIQQIPDIRQDEMTKQDAMNYAKSVAPRIKAIEVEKAIYQAYLQGCQKGFGVGLKVAKRYNID